MSDIDKNTCPVCFTKMHKVKKVLTCPECGYKYCDHNRDREDMFDTSHTHENNYTTYTNTTTSSSSTYSPTYTNPNRSDATSKQTAHVQQTTTSDGTKKKTSVPKLVKIIIIIYLIIFLCPFLCVGVGSILTVVLEEFFVEQTDDYEKSDISSTLPEGIDGNASINLDAEDGDFVPEMIKSMFYVSDWKSITNEQIYKIDQLYIHRDSNNYLYATCNLATGESKDFYSQLTELDPSDLNAFIGLSVLSSPDIHYSAEDLNNLQLLRTISCSNSVSELSKVVYDPEHITDMTLMHYDTVADLTGLEAFTNIENLHIDATNTGIINTSVLADMDGIKFLTLYDNGTIQDFEFLYELNNLVYLKPAAPALSDLSFVEIMPDLRTLNIGVATNITDISPLLARADTLQNLDLSYNPNITDFGPLAELPNLEDVTLSFCNISDISYLSELENLSFLIIGGNQIKSLEPLAELPNLQFVSTSGNPIEDFAGLDDIVMHSSF